MPSNSEIILSANTHPSDSTTQTITGDKFKGDGYYGRSDGLHTVQYTITGFIGTVSIQATLTVDPSEADWFTVYEQAYPVVNDEGTTKSNLANFTGNYVWVRAYITYTDGTVNSILLNH
tara:strand:+ start:5496 stop:5852 length:357 start_codon:yes stop_codon:yes gene_type:complete